MTKKRPLPSIEDQLKIIRDAYDQTVADYRAGVREEELLLEEFAHSAGYTRFRKARHSCDSGESCIRRYLAPARGQRFLDVGAGVNLLSHGLYKWPSLYHGIDISSKLAAVARDAAIRIGAPIGGLIVGDAARVPFGNAVFDILAAIGVLEYYDINYASRALSEFRRVLRADGKAVVDMPNPLHPDVEVMIEYETYLGRPRFDLPSRARFEQELGRHFTTVAVDDTHLMIKYFLLAR